MTKRIIAFALLFTFFFYWIIGAQCDDDEIVGALKIGRLTAASTKVKNYSIIQVVLRSVSGLRNIYTNHLKSGKRFEGNIKVIFNVIGDDKTLKAEIVKTDLTDSLFISEIKEELRKWEFGEKMKNIDTTTITNTFTFSLPLDCKDSN